jgi:hypothetical protein
VSDGKWPPEYKRAPRWSDGDRKALDFILVFSAVLLTLAAGAASFAVWFRPGIYASMVALGLEAGYITHVAMTARRTGDGD